MAEWKKIITSGSNAELNQLTASSGISVAGVAKFNDITATGLANQGSEATAVVINGSNVVGTRELGSNAFTSTTIGTTTNALTVDDETIQLNTGTTFNGSAARTISIKDGGVDSDALAADISVTTLTATTGSISRVESTQISSSGLLLTSASINSIGAFNLGGKLTAGGIEIEGSNFDINGGNIDGATIATSDITVGSSKTLNVSAGTLTTSAAQKKAIVEGVGANVDIGAFDFRANTLIADDLTSGRVVFTTTNGQLTDDADLTFSGATLTGTSGSFGAIASVNISGSLRGDANLNELDVAGSGSFESITISGHASGSFVGDGSGLTGVGTDIDSLDDYGAQTLHQSQDHFLVSDNGTEKRINFSDLEDSIFANVSGDATIAGGGALTIGDNKIGNDELKQDEAITLQSLTLSGDLTVNGNTTTVTSTNVAISDKFMFLASGSTATDGGIIVSHDAANSGSAFGYDVSEERWAFQSGSGAEGMSALDPDAYAVAAVTDDNTAAYRKNGNIRVQGGEIFIYVE